MHTNTSRILTAFSDLEHDGDLVFPSNRDILDYLNRYADMFGLRSRIRFGARVEHLGAGRRRLASSAIPAATSISTRSSSRAAGSVLQPSQLFPGSIRSPARWERSPPTATGGRRPIETNAYSSRAARSAPWRSPPNSPNSAPRAWSSRSAGSGTSCRSSPQACPPTTGFSRGMERSRPRRSRLPRSTGNSRRSLSRRGEAPNSTVHPHPTRRCSPPGARSASSTFRWLPRAESWFGRGSNRSRAQP